MPEFLTKLSELYENKKEITTLLQETNKMLMSLTVHRPKCAFSVCMCFCTVWSGQLKERR